MLSRRFLPILLALTLAAPALALPRWCGFSFWFAPVGRLFHIESMDRTLEYLRRPLQVRDIPGILWRASDFIESRMRFGPERFYYDVWTSRTGKRQFLADLTTYLTTLAESGAEMSNLVALNEALPAVVRWWGYAYLGEYLPATIGQREGPRWRGFFRWIPPVPAGWRYREDDPSTHPDPVAIRPIPFDVRDP